MSILVCPLVRPDRMGHVPGAVAVDWSAHLVSLEYICMQQKKG